MKLLVCLAALALFALAQAAKAPCVPRNECAESVLWNGPRCARVDGVVQHFVDECAFNFAQCEAGQKYVTLPREECDFPQDYGVNPKWIGK